MTEQKRQPILITGIKSIDPDTKLDVIRVEVNANGEPVVLEFHSGVIGGFIIGLMRAMQAFKSDPNSNEFLTQPLALNSARPFVIDHLRFGLELTLERVLKLPVWFPANGLEIWRRVVSELEKASVARPKTQ